jgi:hypothetical protein
MTSRLKSALVGAAVATALTLPAVADNWMSGATRTFTVKSVQIHGIVGNVSVAVRNGGQTTIQISGDKERVDETAVNQDGDTLDVYGHSNNEVWDWRHWLDFSDHTDRGSLSVKVTIPRGTELGVTGLVGDAQIGDTMGSLHLDAVATNTTVGHTASAHVSLEGSGRVALADIDGDLHAETAGDGKITAGNVQSVHADVAGSGAIGVGRVNGEIHLGIAGSGDFTAASINGPAHISIAGSGNVHIDNGTADPLRVDILGSGDVFFGGTAIDPHVSGFGSGSVRIHAIRGKLISDGMANVKIGA